MENADIADIFDEIADLLDLREANQFRIRAYRSAARAIRSLSSRLEDLVERGEDLSKIHDIGKRTAEKIEELLETGTCERLEELRESMPQGVVDLVRVPGLGPRKAMQLYKELGIKSLEDLRRAAEKHKIRDVSGMGEKTEENILRSVGMVEEAAGRISLKIAEEHVTSLGQYLDGIEEIERHEVAGSYRRRRETVGDLDILLVAKDRAKVIDAILDYEDISDVVSRGQKRTTVRLRGGLQVDFRFIDASEFGSALLYFTGSKAHNIALRRRVLDRGWKLNEYGLFKGDHRLAGEDEESVFQRLSLAWIPPELREDRGELEAAEAGELPVLVELDDVRGDLHSHTDETDGADTIEAMAGAARERGYSYLAITDHSKGVAVTSGMNEERLRRHADRIREVDSDLERFWLLAGVEVDILRSGELDLSEDALAELDWVVAAVHSYFDMPEKAMTGRLVTAIRSGVVSCIGHPFCRQIGQRPLIALDFDKVIEACLDTGVCLEVNSQVDRLDLPDVFCQRATEAGVQLAISTDAHRSSELDLMKYGVDQARRGWVEKGSVLNCKKLTELRRALEK